ncbi:MAG TPA: hypothetical protein ENN35_01850 [Deltaproteobacteria bacterium]|nr:hypothetical protein [Deltaproteobacteria bacterium]
MPKRIIIAVILVIIATAGYSGREPARAGGEPLPFPSYGDGSVEVRLYSNYFCGPCRVVDEAVSPLLADLLARNVIRLTIVEVPGSVLFVNFFLYALKADNSFEQATAVRKVLFEAAREREARTGEALAALFRENGIAYEEFDASRLYPRFNELIREDDLRATPTLVTITNGEKRFYRGKAIITALGELAEARKPEDAARREGSGEPT